MKVGLQHIEVDLIVRTQLSGGDGVPLMLWKLLFTGDTEFAWNIFSRHK